MRKSILLVFVLVSFLACQKKNNDSDKRVGFDHQKIQNLSYNYCGSGLTLKEDPEAMNDEFSDIIIKSHVFGISHGSGGCAHAQSIQKSWQTNMGVMQFTLNYSNYGYGYGYPYPSPTPSNTNCIANGSLWTMQGAVNVGSYYQVSLQSYDNPSAQITITASSHLRGELVRDEIGLRILTCRQ